MKKILLLFLIFTSSLWSQVYTLTTKSGQVYTGRISNNANIIEWRKDIYEYTKPNGTIERFILKPIYTGHLKLTQIASVEAIPTHMAPAKYIALSNNIKAKQVIQYKIGLKNKNILYISDFITLSHYALYIETQKGKKEIYLTTIKSLKIKDSSISYSYKPAKIIRPLKSKPKPKKYKKNRIQKTIPIQQRIKKKPDTNKFFFLLILILSLLIISLLIILLVLYKKFTSQSIKKKKSKNLKSKKNKKHKKMTKFSQTTRKSKKKK